MNKPYMLSACCVLVLGVGVAVAQPPGKGPHAVKRGASRQAEAAESLGQSSQLGPSCTECRATTTASDEKKATVYCRSSGDIKWPPCKKTYKTVTHGPPGKQRRYRRATYENNEGEECRFVETSAAKCSNG
jgi:hypothetical protein